jgi:predicted negative regulator of RcsB-dependent stress response
MKKEKLPLEKDVDIEFEYKLYLFWERIRKYTKLIIAVIIAVIIGIFGFIYKKNADEKILNEASSVIYEIGDLYANGKYDKAMEIIARFKDQYGDTPFVKLAVSYEILIKKEKNKEDLQTASNLKQLLVSEQLKAQNREYIGYIHYKEKQYQQSLNILNTVEQKHFNYISAQILKGADFVKLGKLQEAESIFKNISETSNYRYFTIIARENL